MDISFKTEGGVFNYRACAIILRGNSILAMRDARSPYYYLPGGRVRLGETAENAVLREVREELGVEAKIICPLWLNQAFFTEDVSSERYHELCVYFLIDASGTDLYSRGDSFTGIEAGRSQRFEWLLFEKLRDAYFYPRFLQEDIFCLPDNFTLRTEWE